MSDIVVFSNEILNVLVLLGILGLIFTFLLKLYNILDGGKAYDVKLGIIILAVGTIAYLFIEIGVFLNIAQDVEATLLEYNMYYLFARILLILLWVFWFIELIFNAIDTVADPLKRMAKRRNERITR